MTDDDRNERPHLTADVVAVAPAGDELYALLIQRGWPPFEGCWALPGGHVDVGESVAAAAARELAEETGLADVPELVELGAWHAPGRDPRGRYVSVAFLACFDRPLAPTAGDDAIAAHWCPVTEVLERPERLAFDHADMIAAALDYFATEIRR